MTSVIALVCTLTPSPDPSSSQLLAEQVLAGFAEQGCTTSLVRVVDHDVKPGVKKDMGAGDAWPGIRAQVLEADVLLIATPIWMGQQSSVCKRVLERLDAELSEKDEQGRLLTYGKVACLAVVGNEDGAHFVTAEVFQALNDVGFTVPAAAVTYWHGPAMGSTDYKDLDEVPEVTAGTTKTLVANTLHLATLLKKDQYPPAS
ncbi:MAG: NADPH-dependent oxidoreductase [Frankiales bacterium]|jgi:multimeric flavodoxin WrbA|nr:NADPH-dependent oxidoreductase [Frankiales bacterium]